MEEKITYYKINDYRVIWYDTLPSTNSKATEMALSNENDKTVIVANYQTTGRGQRNNEWNSEKDKNLTFSIIIHPTFLPSEKQFLLLKTFSLSIIDYLQSIGINAFIKWPNDIYIEDKKVCGMLIESSISGETINYSIIGIGLNINQKTFNNNILNPTSLILYNNGIEFKLKDALEQILYHIDKRYSILEKKPILIDQDYLSKLYRFNKHYLYESDNLKFRAKIIGVSDSGELILKDENKNIKRFAFKQVNFIM